MNVIPATHQHLPELVRLDLVRLNEQIQIQYPTTNPDKFKNRVNAVEVSQHFEKLLKSDSTKMLMALNNGFAIGYLYFEMSRVAAHTLKLGKHECCIRGVFIDPASRRQGAATALVEFVEDLADVDRCGQVSLDTWHLNRDVLAFFVKKGFDVSRQIYSKKPN